MQFSHSLQFSSNVFSKDVHKVDNRMNVGCVTYDFEGSGAAAAPAHACCGKHDSDALIQNGTLS